MSKYYFKSQVANKIFLVVLLILATILITKWILNERAVIVSQHGYVQSHVMQITAPFEGTLKEIPVSAFDTVAKNKPLFIMDDTQLQLEFALAKEDYQYILAENNLAQAKQSNELLNVELLKQKLAVAEQKNKDINDLLAKYIQLGEKTVGSVEFTKVKVSQAEARQNYLAVKAELGKSERTYYELAYTLQSLKAKLMQAQVNLTAKQNALQKKIVLAPVDGVLGDIKVKPGQLVKAHDMLASFFYDNDLWVMAEFGEKQLRYLSVGQLVTIQLDAFPNLTINGKILRFSPASKREINQSPFPEQYGQVIKTEQQFPVIIDIQEPHALSHLIKPGMLATVYVQAKQ